MLLNLGQAAGTCLADGRGGILTRGKRQCRDDFCIARPLLRQHVSRPFALRWVTRVLKDANELLSILRIDIRDGDQRDMTVLGIGGRR